VLILRGDGARVLRVNVPRRLPPLLAALGLLLAVGVGALARDWWVARQRLAESATLFHQLAQQQAALDRVHRRVAELRREVAGWRDLHARIWEPFGPELAPRGREAGIGGRTEPAPGPESPSPGDELDLLARHVHEEGQSLRALERLISRARKALASLPSRWPVRGRVNSEFGSRQSPWTQETEFHGGIDIAAAPGTPVRAPAAGVVNYAGWSGDSGLTVVVDHGNDIRTVYGHLSKVLVKPGSPVERGTTLGLTGNTGRSSGPHLHYEIVVRGQPVNPRAYLWD
jgi:murein DD-endopeptidase MepM/ murein hydrolase activator NlpD